VTCVVEANVLDSPGTGQNSDTLSSSSPPLLNLDSAGRETELDLACESAMVEAGLKDAGA